MADSRFFNKKGPFTLKEIAALSECVLAEGTNPDQVVENVAGLDEAMGTDLTWAFLASVRENLKNSKAGACITSEKFKDYVPEGMGILLSNDPHRSYGLAAQAFYPREFEAMISEKAYIDETATIGEGCRIEAGAFIGARVVIGKNCWIKPNAVIEDGVQMGDNCTIGSCASVSHCLMGNMVYIYPGARIGQDGFGFAMGPKGPCKVPQLGRVIIGNCVEIGANTTVDRGAMGDTVIGDGTWLDNLIQVGHNVKFGKCCMSAAQAGFAGSCTFGDFVAVGGQAGFAGHIHIGSMCQIGAQSGVMKDLPDGSGVLGTPAVPQMEFMRQCIAVQKLAKGGKK